MLLEADIVERRQGQEYPGKESLTKKAPCPSETLGDLLKLQECKTRTGVVGWPRPWLWLQIQMQIQIQIQIKITGVAGWPWLWLMLEAQYSMLCLMLCKSWPVGQANFTAWLQLWTSDHPFILHKHSCALPVKETYYTSCTKIKIGSKIPDIS